MSLEQEFELIRRVPIFSTTDPAMQKLLCFSSDRLTFNQAQTMFSAGDVQPSAFNNPGIVTLNLRGLGANRNLVLVDGRRPQPASRPIRQPCPRRASARPRGRRVAGRGPRPSIHRTSTCSGRRSSRGADSRRRTCPRTRAS